MGSGEGSGSGKSGKTRRSGGKKRKRKESERKIRISRKVEEVFDEWAQLTEDLESLEKRKPKNRKKKKKWDQKYQALEKKRANLPGNDRKVLENILRAKFAEYRRCS